jgi:hypothetical protein
LGNDLLDNQLPYPLQANNAKPYFDKTPTGLAIRNVPVPLEHKSAEQGKRDRLLIERIYQRNGGLLRRLTNRFELARQLQIYFGGAQDLTHDLESSFGSALELFSAIIAELKRDTDVRDIKLALFLMPGKAFVETPASTSAQLQDFFRKKIIERMNGVHVPVVDLAIPLRDHYQEYKRRLFFRHEGHLTPEGNRVVAEIILSKTSKP